MKKTPKNPVCIIVWHDAAYSFAKKLPSTMPKPQITTGFIISENKKFTNIATTVKRGAKSTAIMHMEGLIIPSCAQISFKKIGYLDA